MTVVSPPSSFSITLPLSMNEGFVWFDLRLSVVHCYPSFALHFLAETHGCFFFHLSLRGNDFWLGEMREERQTNISYFWTRLRCTLQTISLPIYPDRCQTFVSATFCYSTKSPYKHLWLLQCDIQQLILEYYWTTVFYVDWHVLMYILPTIQSRPLIPCDVFKSYSYCYVLKQRLYLPPVLFFHILLFIVNCCGAPASNLALTSL